MGKLVTLPGLYSTSTHRGFPGGASVKNLPANAGDMTDTVRSLGREDPLEEDVAFQFSCWGNPMNRGAWRAIVHGMAESDTTEDLSTSTDREAARKPLHVETYCEISQVKHIRSIKMYIASVKSSIVFQNKSEVDFISAFDSVFHHPKDDAVRVPSPPCGNYLNFKRKKPQKPSPICLRGRRWKNHLI